MNHNANRAKSLLNHYLRLLANKSGVPWDSDNVTEIDDIVDCIIEAAAEEAAKKVMRSLPSQIQE